MLFRGGCLCSEEVAAIYDANREADLAAARKLLPEAEVWAENSMLMFSMADESGREWFGQLTTRNPDWFTKRK